MLLLIIWLFPFSIFKTLPLGFLYICAFSTKMLPAGKPVPSNSIPCIVFFSANRSNGLFWVKEFSLSTIIFGFVPLYGKINIPLNDMLSSLAFTKPSFNSALWRVCSGFIVIVLFAAISTFAPSKIINAPSLISLMFSVISFVDFKSDSSAKKNNASSFFFFFIFCVFK